MDEGPRNEGSTDVEPAVDHGRLEVVDAFINDWVERANAGDWTGFAAMLSPDVVISDPMSPEPAVGREAARQRAELQYAPFPDGQITVLTRPMTRADSDVFAYHWRFKGTQQRPIEPPGFAASGRLVEIEGVSLITLNGGRASSVRLFFDSTEVARQIGAVPATGSVAERALVLAQRLRNRLSRR